MHWNFLIYKIYRYVTYIHKSFYKLTFGLEIYLLKPRLDRGTSVSRGMAIRFSATFGEVQNKCLLFFCRKASNPLIRLVIFS